MERAIISRTGAEKLEINKVKFECCLICGGALSTIKHPPQQQQSLLEKHLEIILLLKNVFKLPSEKLAEFLGKFPDVENWIRTCENCEQSVNQLNSLHKQMISVKMKIIGLMKASLKDKNSNTVRNSKRNELQDNEGIIPSVTDECRQFVKKHKYCALTAMVTTTSDLRTRENHNDAAPEVKQETSNAFFDDNNDNHLSPSPVELNIHPDDPDSFCNVQDQTPSQKPPTRKRTRRSAIITSAPLVSQFPCPKCDQSFPTRVTLNCHITTDHKYSPDVASRTCTICNTIFFDYPTLRRHLVVKHGYLRKPKTVYPNQTKCNECSKICKTPYHLHCHVKRVHRSNLGHLCDLCGKNLASKPGLENHRKICGTRRLEDGSLKKRTKCPVDGCGIFFLRDELLAKHVEKHRNPPTWKCDQCSEKFHFKKDLLRHEQVDHGDGKFICEHCGKMFYSETNLKSHKKTSLKCKLLWQSEGDATFKCESCGRLCASRESLRRHVRTVHERKFDWNCDKCGEGFLQRNSLLFHLKDKHDLGEYKWRCEVEWCGKGFAFKSQLDKHLAVHEGGKGAKCEKCGRGFANKQRLESHKRRVHGKKVNCEFCGREFKSQIYLNFHLKNSHKIKK